MLISLPLDAEVTLGRLYDLYARGWQIEVLDGLPVITDLAPASTLSTDKSWLETVVSRLAK